jgi:hypothetical protein
MDKAHQKLESGTVTLCYPVPRTLQTLSQNSLTQKSEHSHLFESSRKPPAAASQQAQIDELYRQIGQLKVERDFLANRSAQLGLSNDKPW